RFAFDAYLAKACEDHVIESVLPALSLVNQLEQWRPAEKLIWPSTNLDPSAQLCAAQARILASLNRGVNQAANVDADEAVIQTRGLPNFIADLAKLEEYLEPFRNSNVGDILP